MADEQLVDLTQEEADIATLDRAAELVNRTGEDRPTAGELRGLGVVVVEKHLDSELRGLEYRREQMLTTAAEAEIAELDERIRVLERRRDRARALGDRVKSILKVIEKEERVASVTPALQELRIAEGECRTADQRAQFARAKFNSLANQFEVLYREALRERAEVPELSDSDRESIEALLGRELDIPRRAARDNKRVVVDGSGELRFEGEWTAEEKDEWLRSRARESGMMQRVGTRIR